MTYYSVTMGCLVMAKTLLNSCRERTVIWLTLRHFTLQPSTLEFDLTELYQLCNIAACVAASKYEVPIKVLKFSQVIKVPHNNLLWFSVKLVPLKQIFGKGIEGAILFPQVDIGGPQGTTSWFPKSFNLGFLLCES